MDRCTACQLGQGRSCRCRTLDYGRVQVRIIGALVAFWATVAAALWLWAS